MDTEAIARAKGRLAAAANGHSTDTGATLERTRTELEALAERASELEGSLPERVRTAVRDGLRAEALPVGRQLAEVRGLAAQTIRRLERLESDLRAERQARLDDLALLVDLITSGWQGVDARLERLERALGPGREAVVFRVADS